MTKIRQTKLEPTILPVTPILTTAGGVPGKPDDISLGWTGVLAYDPPLIGVSMRPASYAYGLIEQTREFVTNVPTVEILQEFDRCDMAFESAEDKFALVGLTPEPASLVRAPLIKECPVNVECRVEQIVKLGSHHLLVGRVVASHFAQEVIDPDGSLNVAKIRPFVMVPGSGEFWDLGKELGHVGFTAESKRLY